MLKERFFDNRIEKTAVIDNVVCDLRKAMEEHLQKAAEWQKQQDKQSKSAWSEEDEWKFSDILALLRGGENYRYNTPELFAWLKSLKERYVWKPNGETNGSEDLEEEINTFFSDWLINLDEHKDFIQIARHFAEWQREQMMKDAVEAEVMYPASSSTLQIRYKLPKNTKLKYGDKVKIIIVKKPEIL